MSDDEREDGGTVDRRQLLAGLGAAATVGLSGCGGGGEGQGGGPDEAGGEAAGDGDERDEDTVDALGERVPQMTIEYFAGTRIYETFTDGVAQAFEEHLGLNANPKPKEATAHVFDMYQDKRSTAFPLYTYAFDPSPHFTTRRDAANQAGDGIGDAAGQNIPKWANCEYTVRAYEQAKIVDPEERRRVINEARSILSFACVRIPISPEIVPNAFRTDQIDPDLENMRKATGLYPHDFDSLFEIGPVGDNDTLRMAEGNSAQLDITNPYLMTYQGHWANNVSNSPLLRFDENIEVQNNLASAVELEDEGRTVIAEVSDDANFHDGSPVTAEDVKFTYDYMVAGSQGGTHTFTPALPILEEIDEVDEKTVKFSLSEAYVPLVKREFPTWGIQNKAVWMEQLSEYGITSWESHEESFDQFGDVKIPPLSRNGSGPWIVENYNAGETITFTAWDDHPVLTPQVDLVLSHIADPGARFTALQSGQVNLAEISPGQADQVEDDPNMAVSFTPTIQHSGWYGPNWAMPPTKFKPFRQALAAVINRRALVDVATLGKAKPELYSCLYGPAHPWHVPEDMLYRMARDETGNPELGRAFLEEAGWGWDENGNLRYPEGADLSVRWEKGGTPDPADYPCLNESGYQKPEGYEMTDDQVPGYNQDPTDPWPESFEG